MGMLDNVKDAMPELYTNRDLDNLIRNPAKLLNKINRSLPHLDEKLDNLNNVKAKIKEPNETAYPLKDHYMPRINYMESKIELNKQLNKFDQRKIILIEKVNNRLLNTNITPPNMDRVTLQDHLNTVAASKVCAIDERTREINYLDNYIKQVREKCHSHPELGLYESGLSGLNHDIVRQYQELEASLFHQYIPPSYYQATGQPTDNDGPINLPPKTAGEINVQQTNNPRPVQENRQAQEVIPNNQPQTYEQSPATRENNSGPIRAIHTNPERAQRNPSPTRSNSQSSLIHK